jgi:hypothetical protein
MKDRKRTHTQQKYQKYQKWTLFFFGQTNKRRERFEPPKNNTSKTRRHIFSNKTHINNGRRIENEENKNEKAEPTK